MQHEIGLREQDDAFVAGRHRFDLDGRRMHSRVQQQRDGCRGG